MTPSTRPFWLTLATQGRVEMTGVCLEPWQAKPLMDLVALHNSTLDQKTSGGCGWSLRHVREPVMGAWNFSKLIGLDPENQLYRKAYEIDLAAKNNEAAHAWHWAHATKTHRDLSIDLFSACFMCNKEDESALMSMSSEWVRHLVLRQREKNGASLAGGLLVKENEVNFLDPLSAFDDIANKARGQQHLDLTDASLLRSKVESWLLAHQTCAAPAIQQPVRI